MTLAKLNSILYQSMAWHGGHLHEYVVGRMHYGIPGDDWPSPEPTIDERRVRLNTLVEAGARRFTYLYDFGDSWEHTVRVEDLVMLPARVHVSAASPAKMPARRRTSADRMPTSTSLRP